MASRASPASFTSRPSSSRILYRIDDRRDPALALRRELAAGRERIARTDDQQRQQPQGSASQHRRLALDRPMQTDWSLRVQR
jgi:hypothetical protein